MGGDIKLEKENDKVMLTIWCTTYNHEPYIRQCLEGFVMQKTTFRFEAIVHDDASTDETATIIREYAEKYPNIIKPIFETENQYSKKNGTIPKIMNENTHGKYVAFCEGDDYWIDPLKLQKQVDFLEYHPEYVLCFHNAVKYYENFNKIELFNSFSNNIDLSVHDAVFNWFVPTASIVFKSELMKNRPQWVSDIYSGDYTLILLAVRAGKVRYIHGMMSVYRINYLGTSASAMMKGKNVFILEQKILLLNSFIGHVEGRFMSEITSMIACLEKELKFQKYKDHKNVLGMLTMPKLLINKLYKKWILALNKDK